MSRATSYNWEIEVNGNTIHPLEMSEFSEGEEGRIETADGGGMGMGPGISRKYKVKDQVFNIGEIEVTILIQRHRAYYEVLQAWVVTGGIYDVFLIGRNSAGVAQMTFLLTNCECAMGKKNAFSRKSKTEDTKKYYLIPEFVEEVI